MGKKLTTSLLAGVFALSMVVSPVFGQSVEELQAQIQQLLAIISQLQQQIATLQGGQGTTGTYCFNTDLYQGLTSNDVRNLQIVLRVTPTTGYFGSITNSAVKRFQAQYGIPQTGYVGPLTRAKLNELYCTPVTPTTTTTLPGGTTTTTTVVAPSYGTLEVSSYPVSNPQTALHGGQEYELLAAKFKAVGSDITLKKVALRVVHASNDAFPWQAFTTLALYDGSTKLAEIALNSSNAIENTFAQDYTFNISGLNVVIPNNSSKVLTVKGTTVVNPVSNATNHTWTVTLRADQLVFSDTAGVTYSVASGPTSINSQVLNLQSTQTATATVTLAVDNPKAQNVIVSDSSPSRVEVMKFNVGVKNLNATFNSGSVTVRVTDNSYQSLITGVELWDGGTLLANSAPSSWTSENNSFKASITWSNFSLPIAAGTTKTLSVKLVLAQVASNFSNDGTKNVDISAGPSLSGVDTNSNVVSVNGSSLTSEKFYPFLKAPVFALSSATLTASGSTSSKVSDMGTAKIVFTVTANGGDIYIPTSGNTQSTITGKINNSTDITTRAWICTNATENSTTKFWRIVSGNTATCEYNGVFTVASANAGYYYVNISSIDWTTSTDSNTGVVNQNWGIDTLKTGQTYLSGN